jgi:hypothetical protein
MLLQALVTNGILSREETLDVVDQSVHAVTDRTTPEDIDAVAELHSSACRSGIIRL